MYWVMAMWAAETLLEGLLSGGVFAGVRRLRGVVLWICALGLVVASVLLTVHTPWVWVWALPFAAYRLINIFRIAARRLSQRQLRTVSLRTFSWLVMLQLIVVVIALLVTGHHLELPLLRVVVAAQLLCALVLLRSSTHTWQHAMVRPTDTALGDSELPTLSVLVPARNETQELEQCLQALVASNYPKLEIIVLDDCSVTRRTPEIIRSFAHDGVRFIQGNVPDETRWLAKNWACARLSTEASGELLLFCGVDTTFEPHSLRLLVSQLIKRDKDMVSVMPLRAGNSFSMSLLQSMRYYWEICLPRRLFKRPPVLSTCWLIRRSTLQQSGGFEAVSRSITPEAHFARQAVVTDRYSFLRSDSSLGIYSQKSRQEQYATFLRVRYPQLHRRLELVALTTIFELVFLLGPIVGLLLANQLPKAMVYYSIWGVATLCLIVTYNLVAVGARLTNAWLAWLWVPVAFLADIYMLHVSMWKYEFSTVDWKGRNVCIPVMQVISQSNPTPPTVSSE